MDTDGGADPTADLAEDTAIDGPEPADVTDAEPDVADAERGPDIDAAMDTPGDTRAGHDTRDAQVGPCPGQELLCGSTCIDPSTHMEHCGGCDRACFAFGEVCLGGVCTPPADPCAEERCRGRGWCDGGACDCIPGYTGLACADCAEGWGPAQDALDQCSPGTVVAGGDEDDTLNGGSDPDHFRGGGGRDALRGFGGADFLEGGPGDDHLYGGADGDLLVAGSGDDFVFGEPGDDVLLGEEGDDEMNGGTGNDVLYGGPGSDRIFGGFGNDRFFLDGLGDDRITDLAGMNSARCAPGVRVESTMAEGDAQVLVFDTGGTVEFTPGTIIVAIYGCR